VHHAVLGILVDLKKGFPIEDLLPLDLLQEGFQSALSTRHGMKRGELCLTMLAFEMMQYGDEPGYRGVRESVAYHISSEMGCQDR